MKLITKMTHIEAHNFFLKAHNYFYLDLPLYYNFQPLLDDINKKMKNKQIHDVVNKKNDGKNDSPKNYENINYKILNNKDGKYAWRPIEIIHPVLYICLVNNICNENNWNVIRKRFKDFNKNKNIICCSIPVDSKQTKSNVKSTILHWWNEFEQRTISLAIEYEYMTCTDISNCYSSIYTHSIPWALHTKQCAKNNRDDKKLIGNIIDKGIQDMSYGQTNGIPQGSVLMDFIAEMILGYADELLSKRLEELKIEKYKILRYRDDYRIFSNNNYEIDVILKNLTEILSELNFKLNSQKTKYTSDIITNSIKKDKLYRFENPIYDNLNLQKKLFIIRNYGIDFPNCGSLSVLLTNVYHKDIKILTKRPNNFEQLISIVTDIMYSNPRTYAICSAILSYLLKFTNIHKKENILDSILTKFDKIANTDYLDIWIQRITIPTNKNKRYSSLLCQKIYTSNNIWNSSWLNMTINEDSIIDKKVLDCLSDTILEEEVDKFTAPYDI